MVMGCLSSFCSWGKIAPHFCLHHPMGHLWGWAQPLLSSLLLVHFLRNLELICSCISLISKPFLG